MSLLSPKKLYGRWFPELSRFESEKAQRRALSVATRHMGLRGILWAALFLLCFWSLGLVARFLGIPDWARDYVGSAVGGLSFSLGFVWICRRDLQRSLRKQLLERGVPICVRCGYDLRGQTAPRCLECGKPFDKALLEYLSQRKARF